MSASASEHLGIKRLLGLILGVVVFFIFAAPPHIFGLEQPIQRMLAITLLMGIWWITEAIPLAITALLPLALYPLLGIANAQETSINYADKNIFLFIGGFLLAFGLERWGLHRRFALNIIALIGVKPAKLLLAFMFVTWFLSMWISNTATTLMMLPIGLAVLSHLYSVKEDEARPMRIQESLMLGIAYSASLGGIATLIGTPPNIILKGYLEKEYPQIQLSFAKWMAYMIPFSFIFLIILWLFLLKVLPPATEVISDKGFIRKELEKLGRLSRGEKMMLTLFILTALLWIFRADINLGSFTIPGWSSLFPYSKFFHDSTVAMGMAIVGFLLPVDLRNGIFLLSLDELKKLPWHIILLFGGGFALAFGIKKTGLDVFIGSRLEFLRILPPMLMVAGIALLLTFLTEVTSNTATTSALLPVIGPLAVPLGVNPMLLLLPATINASFAFMLPVATPPNAIVFGSGYVRMDTMVRVGLMLNFIGVILTTIFITLIQGAL